MTAWYHRRVKHEPLKPLIPLDDLKKVVAGLVAVPKDQRPGEKQDQTTKTPRAAKKPR
jgi:hypothetical protein